MKAKLLTHLLLPCLVGIAVALSSCGGSNTPGNNGQDTTKIHRADTMAVDTTGTGTVPCGGVADNDACLGSTRCQPACSAKVVQRHCITQAVFNSMFTTGPTVTYTKAQITGMLATTGMSCEENDYLEPVFESGNLSLRVVNDYNNTTTYPSVPHLFSVALFKGIWTVYPTATSIQICRGHVPSGEELAYAYRIKKNATTIAWGDLTVVYP